MGLIASLLVPPLVLPPKAIGLTTNELDKQLSRGNNGDRTQSIKKRTSNY